MAEQFEAAILQNFLLVQADKHGHHLLAALPGIAGQVWVMSIGHLVVLVSEIIYRHL